MKFSTITPGKNPEFDFLDMIASLESAKKSSSAKPI